VSRTYKGVDGYAPIFSYLGTEGYLVNAELREGKQHSQKDTPAFLRGWIGYFHLIETWTVLRDLDSWMRRRLRCFMVKQWINNCHTRYKNLIHLGVGKDQARVAAGSHKGPWALSNMKPLKIASSNRFFAERGYTGLLDQSQALGKTA
jgi:RNA-directed DNA polymerase